MARVYLDLADPEGEDDSIPLGATSTPSRRGAHLRIDDWAQAVRVAHLASAAIRLASIDQVLDKAHKGRSVYHECRRYFWKDSSIIPDDPHGSSCSEWFQVMLRYAIAHNEPSDEGAARSKPGNVGSRPRPSARRSGASSRRPRSSPGSWRPTGSSCRSCRPAPPPDDGAQPGGAGRPPVTWPAHRWPRSSAGGSSTPRSAGCSGSSSSGRGHRRTSG